MNTDRASYVYSFSEKARFALSSLRQRVRPGACLIAGPYAGEFGYELMQWQGYVRARRRAYAAAHVITYPGRDYLYEGCQVHRHDIPLHQAGYGHGAMDPATAQALAQAKAAELGLKDYDVFVPALLCTRYHRRWFWRQEFRLLDEPPLEGRTHDLAFHFRCVQKAGDHAKNYPPSLADELVSRCRERGWSALCVGHPEYALAPTGCEDRRSADLRETVAALCSVRLVAGENSGPMHLANLCGRPTVVWAFAQRSIDYSLRWNPFRVPIYVAANDTHQPAPERVIEAIARAFKDLAEKTAGFTRAAYHLPAQPIAAY